MPKGLVNFMTRAEFVDLVRFLSELGKPGPYAIRSTPDRPALAVPQARARRPGRAVPDADLRPVSTPTPPAGSPPTPGPAATCRSTS